MLDKAMVQMQQTGIIYENTGWLSVYLITQWELYTIRSTSPTAGY